MEEQSSFPAFWWESNACWGYVRSIDDWRTMAGEFANQLYRHHSDRSAQRAAQEMLDTGRLATWEHPGHALEQAFAGEKMLSIGTRREHIGGRPFREWAREKGIEKLLELEEAG